MNATLKAIWPLFLGLILLMTGSGLQGALLGVRATMEDFGTAVTGLIMSSYFGGCLAGSLLAPRFVGHVGHIRVFAAMAALTSVSGLLHGLFVTPAAWVCLSAATGFSFAFLCVVIESWMNAVSTPGTRGKILAAYLFAFYGATMMGQFMLNAAPPEGIDLFVLAACLVSLSLVPVALVRLPAPEFHAAAPAGIGALWKLSPLAVLGNVLSSFGCSTIFALAPVYALNRGFDVSGAAAAVAAYTLGGALLQVPLGMVSDRFDRRKVIAAAAVLSAGAALLCAAAAGSLAVLSVCLFFFGGFSLALYPLSAALAGDRLAPEHFVSASAAMVLLHGAASFAGPFSVALLMSSLGNDSFFPAFAAIFGLIALYALRGKAG